MNTLKQFFTLVIGYFIISSSVALAGQNKPLKLFPIGNKTISESTLLTFTLKVKDHDHNLLSYEAANLPDGATFNTTTKLFSWTPNFDQAGNYPNITFTVSDGKSTDSESITITVDNTNRPPILEYIGPKVAQKHQPLEFVLSGTDPDGDVLIYSAKRLPKDAKFNPLTRTFSWTPSDKRTKFYKVKFTVSDGHLTDEETVFITVNNVNSPPVLSPIGNKTVNTNQLLEFTLNAADVDGDTLTYSASGLPEGSSFNSITKTFSWTPNPNQVGTYPNIRFEVTDGNLIDFELITLTVINANRSPELNPIGNQTVNENQLLEFTLSAIDPDGDALTYTAENLPAGATFDQTTNVCNWTPDYNQSGVYPNITFTVSDGILADSESITLTVNNTNRPPVLDPIDPKIVNENKLLEFTLSATDADGDALMYSAANLPTGAVFDSATRTFHWTPDYTQSGTYSNIAFTVSDGIEADSESPEIVVSNTNRPPVLDPIENKTINAGQLLEIVLNASDPDGDILTFSAGNLPANAVFNAAARTFSWIPDHLQLGTHSNITFMVSDGEFSNEVKISITVLGTIVSGTITGSQTWLKQNSPYFMTGDVTIPLGSSLTIAPGTDVKVTGNFKLKNYGTLNIQGTETESITFMSAKTNPSPGDWGGIYFYNRSTPSIIQYLHVEHAVRGISTEYIYLGIHYSVFKNNQTGIYFYSLNGSQVFNSTIINNTQYGIACITGTNQPVPRPEAHFNSIYDNGVYNWYNAFETINQNHSAITINAENNWWGTTDSAQISNKIWDNADSTYRPKVDFDPFLFGPQGITNNKVIKRFFNPKRDEQASIQYTLSESANVTLKIFSFPEKSLVRTLLNNAQRQPGANTENWDGKNDSSQDLPEGTYIYTINVQSPSGTFSYDPAFKTIQGPMPSNVVVSPNTNFSPFKGERMTITYDLETPALVTLKSNSASVISDLPRENGSNTDFWNGRDAAGNVVVQTQGLVPIKITTKPLPENILVIEDAPSLDITSLITNPYVMRPLYNEVTQITYSINESADVTLKILSPDENEVLATLEQGVSKSAGTYTLIWNGRTDNGETIAEVGDYLVRVEAVNDTGNVVIRDGNIRILY